MKKTLLSFIIFYFCFSCTSNPFFDNEVKTSARNTISGYAKLNNESNNSGIFVWLSRINAYAYTDSSGYYSITIPSKSESVPGGGLSGKAVVYYYMSNYLLDSSAVVLFDNSFKPGSADLGENGIMDPVLLENLVEIKTIVEVSDIAYNQPNEIVISTELTAPFGRSVLISSWLTMDGGLASFIFKPVSGNDPFLIKHTVHLRTATVNGSVELLGTIFLDAYSLRPGSYEVFPYLWVRQPLPDGLLDAIGHRVNEFRESYLKLPIRHEKPVINVVDL